MLEGVLMKCTALHEELLAESEKVTADKAVGWNIVILLRYILRIISYSYEIIFWFIHWNFEMLLYCTVLNTTQNSNFVFGM